MKKLRCLLLGILIIVAAFAKAQDALILKNDSFFEVNEAPIPNWKNESAVILAQKTVLVIEKEKKSKIYSENWVTRTKILLQDKAAVEYWSDFKTADHEFFEMTILKRDGQIINIDTSQFISVSEGYASTSLDINKSQDRVAYKKLAIEKLEVGDIIDYTYQTTDINYADPYLSFFPLRRENTWNNFISYSFSFGSTYPKLKQAFVLRLHPTLYFTAKGINGLQNPKEKVLANGLVELTFYAENLERFVPGHFTNSEKTNPKAKIEVSYAEPYRYYRTPLLIGKQGENSSSLNIDALKRALYIDFHEKSFEAIPEISTLAQDPLRALNELYIKLQKYVFDGESIDYNPGSYFTAYNLYYSLSKDFDAELLICQPGINGRLEDLSVTTDIIFAVRVKTNEGSYHYAFNPTKYSTIDAWDPRLMGNEAYAFKPTRKFKDFEIKRVELPDYKPEMNQFYANLKVELNVSEGTSQVNATTKLSGQIRSGYVGDILVIDEYGYRLDFDAYNPKLRRFYKRLIEKEKAARVEFMKNWIEDDFNLTNYNSFSLISSGFEPDNSILEYKEEYEVDDLFKKAGETNDELVIVDIGRIITSQIALLEKDRRRSSDVFVEFQKQYRYDIEMEVPNGYLVKNEEPLNYSLSTEAGTFITTAKVLKDGDRTVLKVTSVKSYINKYLPKEKWNEMELFLDAAYDFSQRKIVLEKQ
ncbi:MAG: DUF3857 domain-containing protein [Bacteroidia bacterium]